MGMWIILGFGILAVVFLLWAFWQMTRDRRSESNECTYVQLRTIRREQDDEFEASRFEPPDSKAA